jgi:RNA polymerase sigma-70 factor (ECF subfamily)
MMSDEELLFQVQQGDRAALDELAARYYAPLRGYFFRLCGENLQDAEDFTQETFVRLLRYTGKIPMNFRFWVFRVAHNLAYDHFRSAGYQREQVGFETDLFEQEDLPVRPPAAKNERFTEEAVLVRSTAGSTKEMLKDMTESQREVIIMHFYQGLKLEEIAQITETPIGTVKSRLFHGLKFLKSAFAEVDHA